MEDPDGLLTPSAAAAALGVSRVTLYRWARDGVIAFVQPADHGWRRYRQKDIDKLLEPRKGTQ